MNKLFIVLIILVLCLYVRYYIKVNDAIIIVQPKLEQVDTYILLEKNPIILRESIVDPIDLLQTVFKYMFIYHRIDEIKNIDTPMRIDSRYAIIYCIHPCDVKIYHPKNKQLAKYVEMHLSKGQCLILPMFWWYSAYQIDNIKTIKLYDISSFLFRYIR